MKYFNKEGITLVETIISIALLGIVAAFIFPMLIYGVKYTKWNNIKINALNLAQTQTKWLKYYDYEQLGLNIEGYNPKGDIEENEYLNQLKKNYN